MFTTLKTMTALILGLTILVPACCCNAMAEQAAHTKHVSSCCGKKNEPTSKKCSGGGACFLKKAVGTIDKIAKSALVVESFELTAFLGDSNLLYNPKKIFNKFLFKVAVDEPGSRPERYILFCSLVC